MSRMKARVAKRIVERFREEPGKALGVNRELLIRAHHRLGRNFDPAVRTEWQEVDDCRRRDIRQRLVENQAKNAQKIARKVAKEVRKADRILTGDDELDKVMDKGIPPGKSGAFHGRGPEDESWDGELLEALSKMPSRDILSSMTVKELKAEAKEKGVTGYSKMKKVELVEALATD